MADGSFGSNENRRIFTEPDYRRGRGDRWTRAGSFFSALRDRVGSLAPERWVDIVFGLLFLVGGIVIACRWSAFSDALFDQILFPVIFVGGKVLLIAAVIAIIIGIISFRFRRRWYW